MSEIAFLVARAAAVSGMPRKALAKQAGIAPETLSRMCRRGTGDFATISRIAQIAGIGLNGTLSVREPVAAYRSSEPGHAAHDTRSLVMHSVIAGRLLASPGLVEERVLPTIKRFKGVHAGTGTEKLLEQWERAARKGAAALLRICTDPSERGKQLRQASPLSGLLSPIERRQIYDAFAA